MMIFNSSFNFSSSERIEAHEEETELRSLFSIITGVIAMVTIAITAILGNLAVIFVSIYDERLRQQTGNILIVNLSIMDMITGFLVMFPCAVSVAVDAWPFGRIFCDFHGFVHYCVACGTSLNLAFISIDRVVAVLYPLHYPQKMTPRVIIILCVYTWLQGLIIGGSPAIKDWMRWDYWNANCGVEWDEDPGVKYLITVASIFCYGIPAGCMGLCNILIIHFSRKSKKTMIFPAGQSGRVDVSALMQMQEVQKVKENSNKAAKSMMVVIVTYFLCFAPFTISKQSRALGGGEIIPPYFNFISSIMVFASSATNPFIYAILRKDYREAFKKLPRILRDKMTRIC